MNGLEKRFRRLLRWYPRWYRVARGDEIVATHLDASRHGQTAPTRQQRRDLVFWGLRCRLRLRGGRFARTLAIGAALLSTMVGLCVGTYLSWLSAAPLPDSASVAEISRTAVPGANPDEVRRMDSRFGYATEPEWPSALLGGDDYVVGQLRATFGDTRTEDLPAVPAIAERMRDKGWDVHTAEDARLVATRDGLVLRAWYSDGRSPIEFTVRPDEPAAALPAGIAGGALGMLAGWLLSVRVAHLVKLRHPARGPAVAALALLTFGAAGLPWLSSLLGYVRGIFDTDPSYVFIPLWGCSFIGLRAMCWASLLLGITAATVAHWPVTATEPVRVNVREST